MGPKENQSERSGKASPFSQIPVDFAATMKKRMEGFAEAQTELFDQLQNANRHWLDRIQVEANAASEFATKLSSARSLPDAMTACKEWGARRFQMMAEDAAHVLNDARKFMRAGAHLIGNGWQSKDSGAGT